MRRPLIICFAGDTWDGNPHSRHHLMRRFAGDYDVLFVEGIAMRAPVAAGRTELIRIRSKLAQRPQLRTVAARLHVLRSLPIPPVGAIGRRLQLSMVRASVLRARRRIAPDAPAITWFSLPTVAPLLGRLGDQASLLYYQDRYDQFTHVDGPRLQRALAQLAKGCDVTIATSAVLADDLRGLGARPVTIGHGVDLHRFATALPAPPELLRLEPPLVGYVGLLDDYLDLDGLLAVADRLDRGTLVLVGPHNTDVARFRHPRIALLGRRAYAEIPAYMQAMHCCVIPFRDSALSDAVNPIKLYEYLAAGRPVVSCGLPEVEAFADVVELTRPGAAFAEAVMRQLRAADGPAAVSRRRSRVASRSWDAVAEQIDGLMRQALAGHAATASERLHG